MNLVIKSKISETEIQRAVYEFMNAHDHDFQHQMIPYLAKKLLPEFIKMPEVKAVILEYALYAMQEDEDMSFDLIMEAINEVVEYDYPILINKYMVMWFKDLEQQRNDEYYEITRGRMA